MFIQEHATTGQLSHIFYGGKGKGVPKVDEAVASVLDEPETPLALVALK